jgi:MtN3 and saliva related transmembrane protein
MRGRPARGCHKTSADPFYGGAMSSLLIDSVGTLGAILTTICWLPQAMKTIRERDTRAISLPTTAAFTLGIALWLVYGAAIADWPLIASSAVTLALMLVILRLKLRYG